MELRDVLSLSVTIKGGDNGAPRTYTFSAADLQEKFARLPWVARSYIAGALNAVKP